MANKGKNLPVLRKKTKIVATISDLHCDVPFLQELYDNGMNVARLNTAHQTIEQSQQVVDAVRQVSPKIAIMVDTKGPEVRTLATERPVVLQEGDRCYFTGTSIDAHAPLPCVVVSYPQFVDHVPVGQQIMIDDGSLVVTVVEKDAFGLLCVAKNNGTIKGKKSVNIPGVTLDLPPLTPKDEQFIVWCAQQDIDFIAHSFVRNKEDLLAIKTILVAHHGKCKIISKIENIQGVNNLESILDHCHGVMVARGDLAVEIPREKIPVIQKQIVKRCIQRRKPVIVATQMLHSMMENPSPTRAEVSDVANAIFDGADAIMLSGETAFGKYPVEAIKVMNEVALEVEKSTVPFYENEPVVLNTKVSAHLCRSAVKTAAKLDAQAIVADTVSGRTILNMAGYRGKEPIFALCYQASVMRELALSYGVYAEMIEQPRRSTDEFLEASIGRLADENGFDEQDLLVVLTGNYGAAVGASFLKVSEVRYLRNRVS